MEGFPSDTVFDAVAHSRAGSGYRLAAACVCLITVVLSGYAPIFFWRIIVFPSVRRLVALDLFLALHRGPEPLHRTQAILSVVPAVSATDFSAALRRSRRDKAFSAAA